MPPTLGVYLIREHETRALERVAILLRLRGGRVQVERPLAVDPVEQVDAAAPTHVELSDGRVVCGEPDAERMSVPDALYAPPCGRAGSARDSVQGAAAQAAHSALASAVMATTKTNAGRPKRTSTTRATPVASSSSDATARRALVTKLEKRLDAKLGRGDELAWDCGKLFDAIARVGLYADEGMTLEQYAQKRFPSLGYTTLKRHRAVAVRFTRRSAKRHGMHKLALGLEYIDLTPADEQPAELLSMSVVLRDGSEKPFALCTAADLDGAIARLRGAAGDGAGTARLPRGAGSRLKQIESEISRGVAASEARPRVTHRVAMREGKATVLYTLHDVPIESTGRIGRALVRAAQ